MDNFSTIELKKEDFLPYLKWCFVKFQIDPSSRISGAKTDKIGGFIDRFSNQCVNWIIFNHLLRNENFKVDPDYFFYKEKSAKKCADIIGLKGDDGKIVPFTFFEKDKWEHIDDAPFVEVKTLRKEQYCAGLGMTQFDANHYYVYVESDFEDLYLVSLFDSFLKNDFEIKMSQIYIKDNSNNTIISQEPSFSERIATLRLMGIYRGNELKKHNLEFPGERNLRYIKIIERVNKDQVLAKIPLNKKLETQITSDKFLYNPDNEKLLEYLPIYTQARSIQIIHKEKKTKGYLYIKVNESCFFNEHKLERGYYKITFNIFERKSKETEIFNHKSAYDSRNHEYPIYPTDCTNELITTMKSFFNKS